MVPRKYTTCQDHTEGQCQAYDIGERRQGATRTQAASSSEQSPGPDRPGPTGVTTATTAHARRCSGRRERRKTAATSC